MLGKLKATIQEKPYQWQWNEFAFGKDKIMTKAYDLAGNNAIIKEKIWIINI